MKIDKTDKGFEIIEYPNYLGSGEYTRLAQQSSAIGDYDDSLCKPGSSFLWIGKHHHLNREEIKDLIEHLQYWLCGGSFHKKTK